MDVFPRETVTKLKSSEIVAEILKIIRKPCVVETSNGYVRIHRSLFYVICDNADLPKLRRYIKKTLKPGLYIGTTRGNNSSYWALTDDTFTPHDVGSAHTTIVTTGSTEIRFYCDIPYLSAHVPHTLPKVITVIMLNNLDAYFSAHAHINTHCSGLIILDAKGIIDVREDIRSANRVGKGTELVNSIVKNPSTNKVVNDTKNTTPTVRIDTIKLTHPECPVVIQLKYRIPQYCVEYPYHILRLEFTRQHYRYMIDNTSVEYQRELLINKAWECELCHAPLHQYYYRIERNATAYCPICFHYDYNACSYGDKYQIACNPDVQIGFVGHPDGPPTPYIWKDPVLEKVFHMLLQYKGIPQVSNHGIITIPDEANKNVIILIRESEYYKRGVEVPGGKKISAIIVFKW